MHDMTQPREFFKQLHCGTKFVTMR